MRITRVAAEQAHAVPQNAYTARGLFAPEVTRQPSVIVPEGEAPDDGGNYVPPGSTAQNGFKEVKWFRCNWCGEVLRETHVDSHQCEEPE